MHRKTLRAMRSSTVSEAQHRYWSPQSQPYAASDQLLRYLQEGWTLNHRVEAETHWFGETRHTVIYHFVLNRHDRHLPMQVLGSPFVQDLVDRNTAELEIVPVRQARKPVKSTTISRAVPQPYVHQSSLPAVTA